jgi:hypothetical protein
MSSQLVSLLALGALSSLAMSCGPAAHPVNSPAQADQVSVEVVDGGVTFHVLHANQRFDVSGPLDPTVSANTPAKRVEVVGWTDAAVIVSDRYASLAQGMSLCQAGQERFLRVISLTEPPKLAVTTKLESCLQNIELVEPLSYDATTRMLSGAWFEPHPQATKLSLSLDERGAPRAP